VDELACKPDSAGTAQSELGFLAPGCLAAVGVSIRSAPDASVRGLLVVRRRSADVGLPLPTVANRMGTSSYLKSNPDNENHELHSKQNVYICDHNQT
jgi:hypothetical protein